MHTYTEEERAFFYEYVPGHSQGEIQAEFARRFGWEITFGQIKGRLAAYGLKRGTDGRFQKGNISHNKGKKMPPEVYEKAKATMFKKGHAPQNIDPIGTEKMLADGYIWVKINDLYGVKKNVNWKQKHRLVWEEANGPIPEGHLITFLDGDRSNITLNNLALVSLAENGRLNKLGYRSKDKDVTRVGVDMVKIIGKLKDRG